MARRCRRGGGTGRWGLLITALIAGAALCAIAVVGYRSTGELFEVAGYGQADLILRSLRRELADATPSDALFADFLADNEGAGLLYVALLDRDLKPVASAGVASGTEPAAPGRETALTPVGGRFRFTARVPPRIGRPMMEGPMRHRMMHGDDAPPPFLDRAPFTVVLEFEPLVWRGIRFRNNLTLAASLAASALLIASAFAFWRINRRAAEDEARRDERARLAMLGEMTAVLAHEIRNPLAAVKGHAQLLEEMLEEGSAQKAKAGVVVFEAVRLQNLVAELLDFARNNRLAKAAEDPAPLLSEAALSVDPERIEIVAGRNLGLWQLDRARLTQVLTNVLRNALQASPPGAKVTAGVAVEGAKLVFTVEDEGEGIPEAELEAIFEPFHTGRVKGVGLGLAVARRIVEAHGGTLSAANRPGSGALFTISLPRGEG